VVLNFQTGIKRRKIKKRSYSTKYSTITIEELNYRLSVIFKIYLDFLLDILHIFVFYVIIL